MEAFLIIAGCLSFVMAGMFVVACTWNYVEGIKRNRRDLKKQAERPAPILEDTHFSTVKPTNSAHYALKGEDFFNVDLHDRITTLITDKQDFVLTVKNGTVTYQVNSTTPCDCSSGECKC
jgi:hypothetical protein